MMCLLAFFKGLFSREEGQALLEYGLIVFFIAFVCVAALTLLGGDINIFFTNAVNAW